MKALEDFGGAGRAALVRVDFNVPLDEYGAILDDSRIRDSLDTLNFLLRKNCKIILMSHLGRPEGKIIEKLKMAKVAERLSNMLGKPIKKSNVCVDVPEKTDLKNDEILLLENLRFYPEEEKNDLGFAKKLAEGCDFYVNDAFAVMHRKPASIDAISKLLPAYQGFSVERELKLFEKLKSPKKPFVVLIGGAKEDKIPIVEKLLGKADKVLVGGKLSLILPENLKKRVVLPEDYVDGLDIGEKTINKFGKELEKAKTIFWNGPLGKYEDEKYVEGTKKIAEFLSKSKANVVVCGGDTIAALRKLGTLNNFKYVSTAGGAMLDLLASL